MFLVLFCSRSAAYIVVDNAKKFTSVGLCYRYVILLLSSDIRSEGSIPIVKIFDFDFLMIFHSTSLPESKNVF